jgi:hypothetical protein
VRVSFLTKHCGHPDFMVAPRDPAGPLLFLFVLVTGITCDTIEHMVDIDEWVEVPSSLLLDESPSSAAVTPCGWLASSLISTSPSLPSVPIRLSWMPLSGSSGVAWAQARQARLIASLASRRDEPGSLTDWASEEVATALHQSSGTATFRTRQASALVDRLPGTLAAWEAGLLPYGSLEWITPTGHRYVTRPYDYRGDPDPA